MFLDIMGFMGAILVRAALFLMLILLGYFLKRVGVLSKNDGVTLSKVVLNITLPAAILISFRNFEFSLKYLLIPLLSAAAICVMLAAGFLLTRGKERNQRVFYMLALPAYNIGNFTLPFVSSFLGAQGVIGSCLFDMGNSPFCLGLDYTFTTMAVGESAGEKVWKQLLSVFKRPAFTTYCLMMVLSVLHLDLPEVVFDFAALLSPANAPMAMLMIGLMLEFRFDRTKLKDAVTVNVLRLLLSVVVAFIAFNFMPFPYEVRKAVAITAFAPISSAGPAYIAQMKGDIALAGFAGTLSIVIALIIIPVLIALL